MADRPNRHPVWEPSKLSRLNRFLKTALESVSFNRAMLAVVGLPLLLYLGREVFHDALIIDPFSVPKSFEEAGLTPEVMANRIGDALREIETTTETEMKKDSLALLQD